MTETIYFSLNGKIKRRRCEIREVGTLQIATIETTQVYVEKEQGLWIVKGLYIDCNQK